MNKLLIEGVMRDGVGFVCAHCTKFWWSAARGLNSCKAAQDRKPCIGPINEGTFPEYEGELTDVVLAERCFVCGASASHCIVHKGAVDSRKIGVCDVHRSWVKDYSVGGDRPQFIHKRKLEVRE